MKSDTILQKIWKKTDKCKIRSFSELADLLRVIQKNNEKIIIAASVPDRQEHVSLASTSTNYDARINAESYKKIAEFDVSNFSELKELKSAKVVILSDDLKKRPLDVDICRQIEYLISNIIKFRQSNIRNNVVEISYRSNDINSFCYRVIHELIRKIFNIDSCSIYLFNPQSEFLYLSATTGISSRLEKKDIFYESSYSGRINSVFRSNTAKIFQFEGVSDSDFFHEKTKYSAPYSICYLPIRRMDTNTKIYDRTLGVIKILNPFSGAKPKSPSFFHCIDQIELSFLAELVSVLTQNYIRALEAESNFERTIHGFRADLESSADHIDTLGRILFSDDKESDNLPLKVSGSFSRSELKRLFSDSLAFLDDLSFQIEKARQLAHLQTETIEHFHQDVFVPVLKMQHSMIVANSSGQVDLNSLIEAGSLTIPPVRGNTSGYISVFRNIIENSIKYSKPGKNPKIRVSLDQDVSFVYVKIRDFGIGIRASEEKYLFVEGFRSIGARRRTFRGTGIGLAYCRDLMRFLNGDLIYERVNEGIKFIVKIPKDRQA